MASKNVGLDAEISGVQATETTPEGKRIVEKIIEEALRHYLRGYVIRVLSFTKGGLVVQDVTGELYKVRNAEIMVIPDIKGENLVYSKIASRPYTLFLSTKDGKVRFLYSWVSAKDGKRFITVPYHDSQTKDETSVLCIEPKDISTLLDDAHPVKAFEALLNELKVGKEPATNGFKSEGYLWFTKSDKNVFQVSTSESDDGLYWRDEKDGVTNLKYTSNRDLAVELGFTET